jgi:hypothetical protein
MAQAGYRPGSRSYVTQHVERKRERKLLSAYVPAAKRVVREMLNGKVPPGTERAKAGDLLRAAAMILDCEEPVVQKIQTQNVHAVLTPERRRRIAAALGLAPEPEGPPALEAGPPGKPGPAS